jgi:RNA polymerase sigma-B factor
MSLKTSVRAPENSPLTSRRTADDASERLTAMAVLPPGHPSRPALRERAIEAWLPLARHLATRYAGRGEPNDDLIQTAVIGLIKAVDKFDPGYGVDFAGYAIPTIIGEIKRHFRDRTWAIRVPRRLQELRLAITSANATLGGEDEGYALAEARVALGPAMATLDERERRIVTLRFYGNLTQTEIAEQVGISQMHVSRLITRALAKLRGHLS